jgi:diguanylate cyclase (GGDEF)-like protein
LILGAIAARESARGELGHLAVKTLAQANEVDELIEEHGRGSIDLLEGINWLVRLRWMSVAAFMVAIPATWAAVYIAPELPTLFEVNDRAFPLPVEGMLNISYGALLSFACIAACLNAIYQFAAARIARIPPSDRRALFALWLVHGQIALDVITITAICYAFGTFESPLPFFVIFHMVAAASVLTPRGAYLHALAAVLIFSVLANLEYYGIVPHRPLLNYDATDAYYLRPDYLALYVSLLSLMIMVTVFMVKHLSAKVQDKQQQLKSRVLELSSFYNTVRIIGSNLELEQVVTRVMRQFKLVYEVERYALHLVDDATGELHIYSKGGRDTLINRADLRDFTEFVPEVGDDGPGVHVPLRVRDRTIGVLQVYKAPGNQFGSIEVDLLETLGGNIALAALNAALFKSVEQEALTDGLTGLANHRHFYRRLQNEMERARRNDSTVGVVLMDIDHFKSYNDRFGHLAGDQVLREVSKLVEAQVRQMDLVARYGGEEIAVLLPEMKGQSIEQTGERIRKAIDENVFSGALPLRARHVTVSVGVIHWDPSLNFAPETAKDVIAAVDSALYEAKRSGRNWVVVAEPNGQQSQAQPA